VTLYGGMRDGRSTVRSPIFLMVSRRVSGESSGELVEPRPSTRTFGAAQDEGEIFCGLLAQRENVPFLAT